MTSVTADVAASDPLLIAATLGPFFAVDGRLDGPSWLPLEQLRDPRVLHDRVDAARAVIAARSGLTRADIEERATASIVFLGWAARLLSPALACAVLSGEVPAMSDAYWQAGVGSPMPLALPSPVFAAAPVGALAQLVNDRAIVAAVQPLADAVSAMFSVSPTVLWGNVASAIGGAATLIVAGRPERARSTYELVEELLQLGELRGKGGFDRGSVPRRGFRRATCCLFYRIPGAGYCADCVLR